MAGTVTQLWRFPVKSMGGSPVDAVRIDPRGVHADRLWAVRDLEHDITASARKVPALLRCSARYATEPGRDAGPGNAPEVIVTLPDGTELSSADPGIDRALSELAGREVRLTALPRGDDTSLHRLSVRQSRANFSAAEVRRDFGLAEAEALPDTSVFSTKQVLTLARYATPPGTFVDLSPVHVLSTTSLASLSADGVPYDVRRFRPNVLVALDDSGREYPEAAWVGGDVEVGPVVLRVTNQTIRCVVPTRPQPGLELDRGLTRRLAQSTDRFLGVYADVTTPGVVRVGDAVRVREPAPPGAVRRAAAAAGRSAMRQVQRVLEATVLRER
ncbi:MOSC domain-containing protein [Mycolicibacterium pyrenivorans]|uniref:MOSC domain-containing protein n=1 Tax=Mycolicibacterium pyrenivorans TaxID=187102 RepID=UPI0021F307FC|nr:MOSC N-terminal beta barrel domain-containing protein [Mycolicibacterium pyrenivorans]MCV7149830.1 MOSC domain-containing protein [Mycolicibacterium pyrenivorans]